MFRMLGLWFAMNIAIMIIITISFSIIESVFWIPLSTYSGGYAWMLIAAAVIGFSWSFFSLMISKWMAKRAYKINLINESDESNLDSKTRVVYNTVVSLARQNAIKTPEIGIYDSSEPNAFATGPSKNNSLVAVSTWLLNIMDEDAIEGVVAHEMAHILNWDMVTMTLLQWVLNTFVVFISNVLTNIVQNFLDEKMWFLARLAVVIFFQILLGLLASLIAMKFSRYREFRADAGSAKYVWKEKMIAWLEALKRMQSMASEDKWAFAAMQISTKKAWGIMKLFSSHPDLDDRISALHDLRV